MERKASFPVRPSYLFRGTSLLIAGTRLLLALAIALPIALHAQGYLSTTGVPPFSAPEPVEYGFTDSSDGNLHLEIPLGSYPQRGTSKPITVRLVYDANNLWHIANPGFSPFWIADLQAGWSISNGWPQGSQPISNDTDPCHKILTFTESNGTSHAFPPVAVDPYTGCPQSGNAYAADSSGFRAYFSVVRGNLATSVYAPDGTLMCCSNSAKQDSQGHWIQIEDSNGNYLSSPSGSLGTGNQLMFDTLGRTLSPFAFTNPYTLPNSAGTNSQFTLNYTSLPLAKTAFGQSGIADCNASGTCGVANHVPTSIVFSDGSTMSFTYDCDSSANAACGSPHGQSTYYDTLTRVTLRSGGQVTYAWNVVSDPYSNKHLWLKSRTSGGGTWNYSQTNLSTCSSSQVGCQLQTTSTSPNGDYTIYTFTLDNGSWPVQVRRYGATSGLLSTTNTIWDLSVACPWQGCHGHSYVRKLSEKVTVPVPGGSSITKQTAYTYDSYTTGRLTAVKEWKYQPGTSPTFASVPDRATYISYYVNTAPNLINKPISTTLCNNSGSDSACPGGGSKVSQTKITYDSYSGGLASATGVANHDDTSFGVGFTVRGNPTSIQEWVNGTTYLTATRAYDMTGQLTSAMDFAGNVTRYSYADVFFNDNGNSTLSTLQSYTPPIPTNSYLTTITLPVVNGVTMTETMGYYYGSGKLAVSTDVNGQSTFSHYVNPVTLANDAFERPTETIPPVGWSLTNYTSATQADVYGAVEDATPSSACSSCRHNQFLYDTWGRKIAEQLYLPNGTTAQISTGYDSNARVSQVSHPYTSPTSPVYETAKYDGLNRKTSLTHPDSQAVMTAYGANVAVLGGVTTQQSSGATYGYGYPIIVMDEAGKQRQEWLDGFGNVLEVDETSATTAAQGKGTITINLDSSKVSYSFYPCPSCPLVTAYNSGTITITINGFQASTSYGPTPPTGPYNTGMVASSLAGQLNAAGSPVTATVNGSTIQFTAIASGASTNYAFTTSSTYYTGNCPTNPCFSGPSFYASPTSGTMSGGAGGISSSPLVTSYKYDAAGRLIGVYQGVQTRTFVYDGLGRPTSVTTPEGKTDTLAYDSDASCPTPNSFPGQLVKRLDARGIRICYQYSDPLNRLTGKNYSNGQVSISYQYDQGGKAANALSRLTTMTDPSGSETYTYDLVGRLTQIQKVVGSTTYAIGYQYSADGQLKTVRYPSGRVVSFNVDNIGRLASVTDTLNGTNTTRASNYSFNAAQRTLACIIHQRGMRGEE